MPDIPFQFDNAELWSRRHWLRWTTLMGGAGILAGCNQNAVPVASVKKAPAEIIYDQLLQYPGKVPMRAINDRPPCLETPWDYFRHDLTPNDAFYVRWHLQTLPQVELAQWRLKVSGHVEKPLELSMEELRKLPSTSIVAVNQCSGNSRGLFEPRIPGAQWGNGAMSNARWTGVKLSEVLKRAGLKAGAMDVTFAGMDKGAPPPVTVPDFVKSLPVEEANRPEVLLAYDMNGQALPPLNGFPLRLVVPGWYATYWVKAINEIKVLTQKFDGYWMQKAYRIPKPGQADKPGDLAKETIPINLMNVRSFFVLPAVGATLPAGKPVPLEGIAFDGGSGIKQVEVSEDAGKTWAVTQLGDDLGKYSFRRWRLSWTPKQAGETKLLVKATSNSGETQPMTPGWSRAGYLRNVVEALTVQVA